MIGGFKDRVVNAIKEKFGINSPSKVMRDKVGRWIPPGIGEGVEESMPDLEKQLNRELDGLAASVQANVNAGVDRQISARTSPTSSNPRNTVSYIEYNQTINSPKAMSRREIRRETKNIVRRIQTA